MNKKYLLEAASLVAESANDDGTWKIRLISEGKGSSGTYTRELLENHHSAFNDVLSFTNHPTGWDGPETRNFTMIAGEVIGETWVEQDERGMVAVYGNYLPDPEHRDKLERYKNKLGLSIYIEGSGYEDENGEFIVDWFNPNDPYASIDVVVAPGARGRFEEAAKKAYSNRSENENPGTRQVQNKETNLDKETLEAALKPLADALATLVAKDSSAEAAKAQVEADEAAVTSAVESYAEAIEAIDAADLFPAQVESLRKSAKEGKDVAPLIEEAKTIKEAALEAAGSQNEQPAGRVLESGRFTSATDLGKVFG